ncbi:MAG: porphobilinogen synthase [Verrucomicrobiales bacterium]|nr:porphobilinogen synthase [Verrucomicrobiales bacterium]OUU85121.1 MAG: delta-aminolevulinic acid dehydratase [Verrucomicrobiaceae bacterium TMED76]|tara:strand:- start:1116 stop:2099 length:984 start_codon:yes stop_codon:yes gene_type:complete
MTNQRLPIRPRRNRKSDAIRGLCRETRLSKESLIYPLFIHDKPTNEPIDSMPGCMRWSINGILEEIADANSVGINSIVLFPAIEDTLKSSNAEECFNDDGLVQRAIREIKSSFPEISLITDVALDPYNSDGHDGLVSSDGSILNDETLEVLCKQSLSHARAGADIIAPSDMMDGRVGAIRNSMDEESYEHVSIMSYSAKFASAYYGPFRGALNSAPKSGDKKTYQMDPANVKEAVREVMLDIEEGADIVMVKPAGPYLDVVATLSDCIEIPIAAYQVSGEYLMIESACSAGWLDRRSVVLESLTGIHRAGASAILTYYAKEVASWLE